MKIPNELWTSSNGRISLEISIEDALVGSHQGDCSADIESLREIPYIKEQLIKISKEDLIYELEEFGCWDEAQLDNHEDNLERILWIACGDINDN